MLALLWHVGMGVQSAGHQTRMALAPTPEAMQALGKWYMEGRLKYRVDVVEGLEHAPDALNRLFDGANTGKLLVKVS